uniref:Centrosomal protein CEP104 Zn finger domain-containing protein n=1 Tax=Acrobeloides nanus TaxID=290746 RepID=A0A914CAQ4_9BILA
MTKAIQILLIIKKYVIETQYLKQHLLFDCSKRAEYRLHDRCQQPIEKNLYNLHASTNKCIMAQPESIAGRCLLCNMDVSPNNDIGWRKHLIEKCTANGRRKM